MHEMLAPAAILIGLSAEDRETALNNMPAEEQEQALAAERLRSVETDMLMNMTYGEKNVYLQGLNPANRAEAEGAMLGQMITTDRMTYLNRLEQHQVTLTIHT